MTIEIPTVKRISLKLDKPKPLEFVSECENLIEEDWELCLLVCPKGHEKKLSIVKHYDVRNTFCARCGKQQLFKRKRHNLTNGATDTASHPLHGLPTAVQ
jgi:hypothetical protein